MSQSNWTTDISFADTLSSLQKRMMHEQRRPSVRTASDIMGPALGPFGVQILDWNEETTTFNGMVWSGPGALNTPTDDDTKSWMGWVIATDEDSGLQFAVEFEVAGTWTPVIYVRQFTDPGGGGTRLFSEWTALVGGDSACCFDWTPVLPTGFTAEGTVGGIICSWDGTVDGGEVIPVPGFDHLEIMAGDA